MSKTCENCGQEFIISRKDKANRFCSQKCYFEWRIKRRDERIKEGRFERSNVKKTCENCGKEIYKRYNKPSRFCSRKCYLEWRGKNKQDSKTKERKRYWNLRNKALEKLGGKCAKCGLNDIRALQIDHINGGGVKEIRKIGNTNIYKKIVKNDTEEIKKEYQLLCANCNWIKRYEKKEHTKWKKK